MVPPVWWGQRFPANVWLGTSVEDQPERPLRLRRPMPLSWVIVGGESGPGARPMHPYWARSLRDQCEAGGVPFFFKQWGSWSPVQKSDATMMAATGRVWDWTDGWLSVSADKHAAGRVLDGRVWDEMPMGAEVPAAEDLPHG